MAKSPSSTSRSSVRCSSSRRCDFKSWISRSISNCGFMPSSRDSDAFFFEQRQELTRTLDLAQPGGHVGLLRKLRDLAENGEGLIGCSQRGRDAEEDEVDGLLGERPEVQPGGRGAGGHAQAVGHQGSTVGNGDPFADPGGAQILSPLQHLVEDALGFLVEAEDADQLLQYLILRLPLQVELYNVFRKKFPKLHVQYPPGVAGTVAVQKLEFGMYAPARIVSKQSRAATRVRHFRAVRRQGCGGGFAGRG